MQTFDNLAAGNLIKCPKSSVFENISLKNGLYVRKEYIDMLSRIGPYLQKYRDDEPWRCLVLGTPGIGKSMFGIYLIMHHILERRNVVYIPLYSTTPIYLTFNSNSETPQISTHRISNHRYHVIYDGTFKQKPFIPDGKSMVLLSSPRAENYNEFKKLNCKRFYLNPWSKDELQDFVNKSEATFGDYFQRYNVVGGIPRCVTNNII